MIRYLSVLSSLLFVCTCSTPPRSAPGAVVVDSPTVDQPASKSSDIESSEIESSDIEFELFLEPFDLGEAATSVKSGSEFVGGYVFLRGLGWSGPRFLLDVETLELQKFPPLVGDPQGKYSFYWDTRQDVAYAHIETPAPDRRHLFQALRFDPVRWEVAGEFEHPRLEEGFGGPNDKAPTVTTSLLDGLIVTVDDARGARNSYMLDDETLVWTELEPPKTCRMPCFGLDEDVVRWGAAPDPDKHECVSVRASEDDDWTRMPDTPGLVRRCRRLDQNTVLAVSGLKMFLPFPEPMTEAHLITLHEPRIEAIGQHPELGVAVTLPGDEVLWLKEGSLVTFDPKTRAFTEEAAPEPDWKVRWQVRLDERTTLIGGLKDDKAVAARLGFREKR